MIVFIINNIYFLLSTIWNYVSYFLTYEAFYIFFMSSEDIFIYEIYVFYNSSLVDLG